MRKLFRSNLFFCSLLLGLISACNSGANKSPSVEESSDSTRILSDDSLLTLLQYQTFQYFWDGAEENSGLARERIHMDGVYPQNDTTVVTSGGSGFGLMALIVGVERGFISKEQALDRFEKILDFLETADRFHGVWPHWWEGRSGKTKPFSKKDDGGDLVESSFLAAGLISIRQYLNEEEPREKDIQDRINKLWEAMEFDWYTRDGENVLYWHWSPNYGWDMNFAVRGYNETLIMYILAAASPTHGVDPEVYHQGWARGGEIANDTVYYGLPTILDHYPGNSAPVGPLFWAHYSFLGLNPMGLSDQYGSLEDLNKNHALIHYKYAIDNPEQFEGYGEKFWGLTSSYSIKGYAGHRPGNDLGVISPTAALSSLPYTPDQSMSMIRALYTEADSLIGEYGPYDAFSFEHDWMTPRYLAIDQGPIPVMIENYRTGLIWNLFMSAPEIQMALEKLGFKQN